MKFSMISYVIKKTPNDTYMLIYRVTTKVSEQECQDSRNECISWRNKWQVHSISKLLSTSNKIKAKPNFKQTNSKTSVTQRRKVV